MAERLRGLTLSRNAWTRLSWHSIDESDAESSAGRVRVVTGSCGDEALMMAMESGTLEGSNCVPPHTRGGVQLWLNCAKMNGF